MGIKGLFKFIQRYAPGAIKELSNNDLKNKTIAFDTSILLYQFAIAIRNRGKDLQNNNGEITSHIHGIIMKTLSFLKKKINPVYVFDGKPPDIKYDILKERNKSRKTAIDMLDNISEMDLETKIKLLKQSVVITGRQMNDCKEILRLIGIPVIQATQEADSQCALLSKLNYVDAVASEDMDLLTFGTEKLLRNINGNKIIEITLSNILKECGLTYDQFIDLCIMMGCDYCPTIDGIGMHNAYKLIKKYDNLDNIVNGVKMGKKTVTVSDEFKTRYLIAREYFKNPPVNMNMDEIKWDKIQQEKLTELLVDKYSYSEYTVRKLLLSPLYGGHYAQINGKTHRDIFIDKEFDAHNNIFHKHFVNFEDQFLDDNDDKENIENNNNDDELAIDNILKYSNELKIHDFVTTKLNSIEM